MIMGATSEAMQGWEEEWGRAIRLRARFVG
jgi:hypothetical protein